MSEQTNTTRAVSSDAPETREEKASRLVQESGKTVHSSDCATSCAPAMEPSACDCDEPQPCTATAPEPTTWQMPDVPELFKFINSTPLVASLLYDINLLPEQIDNARHWNYMCAVCGHMRAALAAATPD